MSTLENISIQKTVMIGIPEDATYVSFDEEEQNEIFQHWLAEEGLILFKVYYDKMSEDLNGE